MAYISEVFFDILNAMSRYILSHKPGKKAYLSRTRDVIDEVPLCKKLRYTSSYVIAMYVFRLLHSWKFCSLYRLTCGAIDTGPQYWNGWEQTRCWFTFLYHATSYRLFCRDSIGGGLKTTLSVDASPLRLYPFDEFSIFR